ncbi:sialin-like isoform X1 [Pomacea canaliculata]|uniref:sialin-like isoform X1 n=1 Tax=Pomacea canaliculata TaxID=400727 RepID=UPI000D72B2CD|nr:sialin-like isoform X1 [Pomacea canaliculata]
MKHRMLQSSWRRWDLSNWQLVRLGQSLCLLTAHDSKRLAKVCSCFRPVVLCFTSSSCQLIISPLLWEKTAQSQKVSIEMTGVPKAPALCSQRWNLAVMCFFGLFFTYVVRMNLSVAIICMVRTPQVNVTSADQRNLGKHGLTSEVSTGLPNVTADTKTAEEYTTDENDCSLEIMKPVSSSNNGEFDWNKGTQSLLLAMYFYGYIFTQIPGGWLVGRYGGRRVWAVSQSICALSTLATPLAARAHVYLVYALRFLLGLAAGVATPCVFSIMGRWAPKLERSKLMSFCITGFSAGNILTFSLSALLCVYGFDNGWGSIFYLSGIGNLLWVVVWCIVTADTPAQHKRISEVERNYIQSSIGDNTEKKEILPTPWRAIFTSAPFWACVVAEICSTYTAYTLQMSLPAFMKESLKFDIKQNGVLSALPYLCQAVTCTLSGQMADTLRNRDILSTKNTRKLFYFLASFGSAICIVSAGYVSCTQRPLAVFLLCLCLCFNGFSSVSFFVNHFDLAPRHAGMTSAISNTAATASGMVAPLVVGALTPNRTAEEWRHVFYVCASIYVAGAVVYGVFAEGELQSWAVPPPVDDTVRGEIAKGEEDNKNPSVSNSERKDVSLGDVTPN